MSRIKIYLDEDVNPLLASDLRQRGYDAVATGEAGNYALSDSDQLEYARREGRAILTHNRDDFLEIAKEYAIKNISHAGILYIPQLPYNQLLHRIVNFLASVSEDQARDVFLWIP